MGRYTILGIFLMVLFPCFSPAADNTYLLNDQCVRCHLTCEQSGRPNSVLAWRKSVHFRPDAGCTGCHGSNKSIRMDFRKGHIGLPDRSRITEMCGSCHAEEQKQFLEKKSVAGPSMCTVNCTDCHGYHLVRPAAGDLINSVTCGRCHTPDRATILAAELGRLETRIQKLTAVMESNKKSRVPVDTARLRLAMMKKNLSRVMHSRKFDDILKYIATQANGDLDAIEKQLTDFSPRNWRLEGVVATGVLVLAFILLLACQASLRKKE